jgi:hypothetical protein
MTKEELDKKTDAELTPSENALINFNIYYNADHIEYYQNYHMGKYKWCYNYLMKNRHLLAIQHTPIEKKQIASKEIIFDTPRFFVQFASDNNFLFT